MAESGEEQAACPVDHKTREAWLAKSKGQTAPHPLPSPSQSSVPQSCDSSTMDQSTRTPPGKQIKLSAQLDTYREVSSIPRALPTEVSDPKASIASNNEQETGASASGHWVYPSERMFFDALKRKNMDASAEDMQTIVPIHNAVNEKAWQEIQAWEKGRGGDKCGGPKLQSFSGLSSSLTPKARLNVLMGYQPPFDRHDWVVDRCGTRVDYVIDFYSGKDERIPGKPLNFYLDVRPKLNTLEGCKMRLGRIFGF